MKRAHGQMSESLLLGALLAMAGGFFDAYTYLCRGKVFANAQTGNIVLMSQSLFDGDLSRFAHYFIPVLSFALGVAAAECIRLRWRQARRIHWRQLVVLAEIVLLDQFSRNIYRDTPQAFAQDGMALVLAQELAVQKELVQVQLVQLGQLVLE